MLISPIEQNIIDLRKKKYTYHNISKELNCPLTTVQKTCFKFGIAVKIQKLPAETISLLKETYKQTKSQRKTAKLIGCSKSTVAYYTQGLKEKRKKQLVNGVISWRRRTKEKLVAYKGGKCEVCEYDRCLQALEFHHLNPEEKDFTISGKSWSFERMKAEVDKCILLCSNCHQEVEHGIINLNKNIINEKNSQYK